MYFFHGQFVAVGRLFRASESNIEWRREFANRLRLEAKAGVVVIVWVNGQAACVYGDDNDNDHDLLDDLVASGGTAFVSECRRHDIGGREIAWNEGEQSMTLGDHGQVSMHWTEGDGGDSFPSPNEIMELLDKLGACLVHELSAIAKGHLLEEERKAEAEKEAELERLRNDDTDLGFLSVQSVPDQGQVRAASLVHGNDSMMTLHGGNGGDPEQKIASGTT